MTDPNYDPVAGPLMAKLDEMTGHINDMIKTINGMQEQLQLTQQKVYLHGLTLKATTGGELEPKTDKLPPVIVENVPKMPTVLFKAVALSEKSNLLTLPGRNGVHRG